MALETKPTGSTVPSWVKSLPLVRNWGWWLVDGWMACKLWEYVGSSRKDKCRCLTAGEGECVRNVQGPVTMAETTSHDHQDSEQKCSHGRITDKSPSWFLQQWTPIYVHYCTKSLPLHKPLVPPTRPTSLSDWNLQQGSPNLSPFAACHSAARIARQF